MLGIEPSLFRDLLTYFREIKSEDSLISASENYEREKSTNDFSSPIIKKAWHLQVATILELLSSQYKFNLDKDWYSERRVLIGRFGKTKNLNLGVLCIEKRPSKKLIPQTIEFVKGEIGSDFRLICAIRKGGDARSSHIINGVEVQLRFNQELTADLVDFQDYKREIKTRFEDDEVVEGFGLSLNDVYVAGSAHKIGETLTTIGNIENEILNWSRETSHRHIAVLGEYGQGKSVLALKITFELLCNSNDKSRIPILIELSGKSPRTQSALGLIAEWAAEYGINPKAVWALHEAGQVVFIFDAFDEMDLVGDQALRLEHFRRLWEFSQQENSKVLITGRPNFFLDEREENISLNITKTARQIPHTEAYNLKPFTSKQIQYALRNVNRDVRQDILKVFNSPKTSSSFRDLISRPSTLFFASTIWENLESDIKSKSANSAKVIREFINHCYERQQKKSPNSFLTVNEREYFMIGVALGMMKRNKHSNFIETKHLNDIIQDLYENFPEQLYRYETTGQKSRPPIGERLDEPATLLDTLSTDVRSCGILVTDLSRRNSFKFAHKSFFEYLIAANVVNRWRKDAENRDVIIHRSFKNVMGGVQLFNPEILKFTTEILQYLVNTPEKQPETLQEVYQDLQSVGIGTNDMKITLMVFRFILPISFPIGLAMKTWGYLRTDIPILINYCEACGVAERELTKWFGSMKKVWRYELPVRRNTP